MPEMRKRLREGLNHLWNHRIFSVLLLLSVTVLLMSYLVTAKNLLIIIDGDESYVIETYADDTREALDETGIKVRSIDTISLPKAQFENGVSTVTIDRTYAITVNAGNNIAQVRTEGEPVGDVLARIGVVVGANDQVTPALTSYTSPGMTISVVHIDYAETTQTEEIAYTSKRVANSKLNKGSEKVAQAGVKGVKTQTYQVTLRNGVEASRVLKTEAVTTQPVEEIIEYGTYVKPTPKPTPKPTAQPAAGSSNGGTPSSGGVTNNGNGGGKQYSSKYKQGSGIIDDKGGTLTLPDGTVLHYSKALDMKATAYTSQGQPSNAVTALGTKTRVGVCAVDPRVIPLKTRLYIVGPNGSWVYGYARAEDVGGAVKGYIVDVFFPTQKQVNNFGRRSCTVYVLK